MLTSILGDDIDVFLSRIPVEEMLPRYGSYPGFHPIVELSTTFHTQVAGASVASPVIAVTSLNQTNAIAQAHSSGTRLRDHADLLIDLCTPAGERRPRQRRQRRGGPSPMKALGRGDRASNRSTASGASTCSIANTDAPTIPARSPDADTTTRKSAPVRPRSSVASGSERLYSSANVRCVADVKKGRTRCADCGHDLAAEAAVRLSPIPHARYPDDRRSRRIDIHTDRSV